jgi:broad specificity phosphatase PhoE
MDLLFLRHGLPEYPDGVYPDPLTLRLSAEGRAEAAACIEAVKRFDPEIVLASDFRRAAETAEIATSGITVTPSSAPELRERVFYSLIGMSFADILREHGEPANGVLSGNSDLVDLPGEESYDTAQRRVTEYLKALHARYSKARVLAVSHGGPHAWIVGDVFGVDMRGVRTFNLGMARFSRFTVTDRGVALEAMNLPAQGVGL